MKQSTSTIKRAFLEIYKSAIKCLSLHKQPAHFLSHGGLHLLVLIACVIGVWYLGTKIMSLNQRDFRQFSLRIEGDTLKNYKISHISGYLVPHGGQYDDQEFLSLHFKFGMKQRHGDSLHTWIWNKGTNRGKEIDAVQKISLVMDQIGDDISVQKSIEGEKKPEKHKTAIVGGNYTINRLETYYCYGFEKEDTVKEDEFGFSVPNLTKEWRDENPYFCCFYGIHAVPGTYDLDSSSVLTIQYNRYPYKEAPNPTKSKHDMFDTAPMSIENVYPQPTLLTIEKIEYRGKDIEKVFEQGGIYVTAVDPVKKAKASKKEILFTVLIGTLLAFILDICIQLVLKWRKLPKEN